MDPLTPLRIERDTATTPDVAALLSAHLQLMRAQSPEESCHVMAPDALLQAGVILLAARRAEMLLGVGALKRIGPHHAELKSMHTAQAARGAGVGTALLGALLAEARAMGATQLSLETGSASQFAPARSLYAAHGFTPCPPFGDYSADPLSVFMTRPI